MTHYLIPETLVKSLPEGWTVENPPNCRTSILSYPGAGFVSICWQRRCFETGYTQHPRESARPPFKYSGRGWQDRLLADAVEALKKIYE